MAMRARRRSGKGVGYTVLRRGTEPSHECSLPQGEDALGWGVGAEIACDGCGAIWRFDGMGWRRTATRLTGGW